MIVDWNVAKDKLIEYYFPNDTYMRGVAEEAYMGDWKKQEELAHWFEEHNFPDLARAWSKKADLIKKDIGIEEDLQQ